MVEAEHAFDVLLAHGWQDERADDGETDLAAVRVAGEHQVDQWKTGVLDDGFDVVRLVAHEDDGGAGIGGDGEVEVRRTRAGIIRATKPEEIASAFEGEVAIDEDGRPVGFDRADHVISTDVDVVIAEDAEALGCLEGGENLCGYAGGLPGNLERERAAANKIAGHQDQIRGEGIDLRDHLLEEVGFGELFQVQIAHLDDAKPFKAVRELTDGDGETGDFEFVARVGSGINADADARSREGRPEKATAGEMK